MIQNTELTPKSYRAWYYASSVVTLLAGIRPLPLLAELMIRGSAEQPVHVRRNGSRRQFLVGSRLDLWTIKEVCLDRDYERAGEALNDGWVVVDVGAGIGEFAIDAAASCPSSVIHAFEPSPSAYALLRRNIALNAISNVHAYQVAIGAATGSARLDVSQSSTGVHRLDTDASAAQSLVVESRTLERVFADLEIAHCDFLKIDCEGSEYDILPAAPRHLLDRIERICVEYHDGPARSHSSLVEALADAGFSVRLTASRAYQEIGFLYAWKP